MDTSIWSDHLRATVPRLVALLEFGINRIGTGSTWSILEEASK
ncbi:MAG: hypothetical protein NT142_13005 [Planctomycetota bacterium]|nr:hypothetical protein [Planctomycetota bacterium]